MIIGVDRLDYSKGIPERLDAFERFLAAIPNGRASHLSADHAAEPQPGFRNMHDMDAGGERACRPHQWQFRRRLLGAGALCQPAPTAGRALAGLYRAARAGLVTPLRDGMNLVAKEYVAAQNAEDPGVLILSRFAGAARECKAALLVNPYDPEGVAMAINRALSMSLEERRQRHAALYKVLLDNDLGKWADRFLGTIERVSPQSTAIDICHGARRRVGI